MLGCYLLPSRQRLGADLGRTQGTVGRFQGSNSFSEPSEPEWGWEELWQPRPLSGVITDLSAR